jgi:hypothetical protein
MCRKEVGQNRKEIERAVADVVVAGIAIIARSAKVPPRRHVEHTPDPPSNSLLRQSTIQIGHALNRKFVNRLAEHIAVSRFGANRRNVKSKPPQSNDPCQSSPEHLPSPRQDI